MESSAPFGQREFRNVLGLFATGVAVVTARVGDARIGATISSFNSVSLDPPLVLFSMACRALASAQWKAAKALTIFVLSDDQVELSNRFARAGGDKWSGLEERTAGNGSPWLPGAIVSFDCVPYAVYPGGDHDIFICEVKAFAAAPDARPLIFYAGKYRDLKTIESSEAPPFENMWLHGW